MIPARSGRGEFMAGSVCRAPMAGFCRPCIWSRSPVLRTFVNRVAAGAMRENAAKGEAHVAGTVTHDPPSAASGRPGRPMIVTEDAELLDDLLRLCAAAGAKPEVHHGPPDRGGGWESAPLVLVGDEDGAVENGVGNGF